MLHLFIYMLVASHILLWTSVFRHGLECFRNGLDTLAYMIESTLELYTLLSADGPGKQARAYTNANMYTYNHASELRSVL